MRCWAYVLEAWRGMVFLEFGQNSFGTEDATYHELAGSCFLAVLQGKDIGLFDTL
jgi:hypothetical protein